MHHVFKYDKHVYVKHMDWFAELTKGLAPLTSCECVLYCSVLECNFEEDHLCGYRIQWNPNVNWLMGGSLTRDPQSTLPYGNGLNNDRGTALLKACSGNHNCSSAGK